MAAPLGFMLSGLTGLPPSRLAELAATVEARGYSAIALTESYRDVMPLAAAVAGLTRSATIATTVANIGFRHPAMLAMSAAVVDELSNGRFVLGLGLGTQWFDQRGFSPALQRPLAALTEYLALLRQLWSAGTGGHPPIELDLYHTDAFHLDFEPLRQTIPVFLAAMGPAMLRLSGRLADGVFIGLTPLESVSGMVEQVREAAATAGRDPRAVTIAMSVRTCLDDDLERAREGARSALPLYLTFPGYARHLTSLGYGTVVEAVQAALARGDRQAATTAIPFELVERVAVFGSAERCLAGLERFRAAGLDLPIVSPRLVGFDWVATLQRAIDAFAPEPSPGNLE